LRRCGFDLLMMSGHIAGTVVPDPLATVAERWSQQESRDIDPERS
jgi:hypothetical protein